MILFCLYIIILHRSSFIVWFQVAVQFVADVLYFSVIESQSVSSICFKSQQKKELISHIYHLPVVAATCNTNKNPIRPFLVNMDSEDDYDFKSTGIGFQKHEDSNSEVDSSDGEPEYVASKRGGNNDEHIYGIFGESSSGEEDVDKRSSKRKRKRSNDSNFVRGGIKWKTKENESSEAWKPKNLSSMFVKSSSEPKKDESRKDTRNENVVGSDTKETNEINLDAIERKKEIDEADKKFKALLERGRGKMSATYFHPSATQPMKKESVSRLESNELQNRGEVGSSGLGFQTAVDQETIEEIDGSSNNGAPPALASFFSSSSHMNNFIGKSQPRKRKEIAAPTKRDPNLGTWEKHTKGIGMKLLSKMGYTGSGGLGAKRLRTTSEQVDQHKQGESEKPAGRKGISRPVEVKVRPQNLGLGFGSFKEATRLKANKQIEAEAKGIDWKKQEQEEKRKKEEEENRERVNMSASIPESLLPSTNSLLTNKSWQRKGKGSRTKRKENPKRNFVSYQDIISGKKASTEENTKVVDMRGPGLVQEPKANENVSESSVSLLGEELLYNVTFLLNSCESKIHAASHFVKSSKNKTCSLKSDVENMIAKRKEVQKRRAKMQKVCVIIESIQSESSSQETIAHIFERTEKLIQELSKLFSLQEKESLQYYEVLVPSLIGPIIVKCLNQRELKVNMENSAAYMNEILSFCSRCNSDAEGRLSISTTQKIFVLYILPLVKKVFQSSKWRPEENGYDGVSFFESTSKIIMDHFPKEEGHRIAVDDSAVLFTEQPMSEINDVTMVLKNEVMFDIIFPKLSHAIKNWGPSLTPQETIKSPLHYWIIPWLPHLNDRTMLTRLIPDIKKKLRSGLVFLSKQFDTGRENDFFMSTISLLKPWKRILDDTTLHAIISDCISPRLARSLSRFNFLELGSNNEDMRRVDTLFLLKKEGLLSSSEFLSIAEGELLSNYAMSLHSALISKELNMIDGSRSYARMKAYLLSHCESRNQIELASKILRKDRMICRMFYGCLLMIQAASQGENDDLLEMDPHLQYTNYKTVQARRAKEDRLKEEEEEMNGKVDDTNTVIKTHVSVHGKGGATFKDVVGDFARHHDVSFYPKSGPNSNKDGKPIFLFGDKQVYLDSNVIFALQNNQWRPSSLDNLIT